MAFRVNCIKKQPRDDIYRSITHLGGSRDENGQRWQLTQLECIYHIKQGLPFYVDKPPGERVYLVVATNANGKRYIKTETDGDEPSNLLSLPQCPEL